MKIAMKFFGSMFLGMAALITYSTFTGGVSFGSGILLSIFFGIIGIGSILYKGEAGTKRTYSSKNAEQLAQGLGMIASAMQSSNKKKSSSNSSYQPSHFGTSPTYRNAGKEAADRVSKVANENYAKSQAARKSSPTPTPTTNQRNRDQEILDKNRNAAIEKQMRDEGKWS